MNFKIYISFSVLIFSLIGCTQNEELNICQGKGQTAVVYATIGNSQEKSTRGILNSYDQWSIASFGIGDNVGFYSTTGIQNPNDPSKYDQPINNGIMYFEGYSGTSYRFSNSEIIIEPSLVGSGSPTSSGSPYSMMYYPYYEDMPDPTSSDVNLIGLPLRINDNGVEKCVDFMQTSFYYSTSSSSNTYYRLKLTDGVLQPTFYHYMSELIIQRGKGFDNPPDNDRRIWVILKNKYTDIRVRRTSTSTYYSYSIQDHSALDTKDQMITLVEGLDKTTFNKYRVWEAWQGNNYNSKESYYAIIPPMEVSYILIQDNNGVWQTVTDFYLSYSTSYTSKTARSDNRYIITVQLEGLNPVVRPVIIENWTNGGEITDQRDVGINSLEDYYDWVSTYNTYVEDRNEAYVKALSLYGDHIYNKVTNEYYWTFYINNDFDFPSNFDYKIVSLDDTLMGSSVYKNYSLSNINATFIGKISEKGKLEALDFNNLYIIDTGNNESESTGGIATIISGGSVNNCNIENGIIVSDKPTGMVAGSISGGKITNCVFSGQVIGANTSDEPIKGLFGSIPSVSPDLAGTSFKELYFETFN